MNTAIEIEKKHKSINLPISAVLILRESQTSFRSLILQLMERFRKTSQVVSLKYKEEEYCQKIFSNGTLATSNLKAKKKERIFRCGSKFERKMRQEKTDQLLPLESNLLN